MKLEAKVGGRIEPVTQFGITRLHVALDDVARWLGFKINGEYLAVLQSQGRRIFRRAGR